MSTELPRVERSHDARGVWTLTISAPWRGNSLDRALLDDLEAALLAVGAAEDARVVVLRGAGPRSFCTGYHLPSLLDERAEGPSVSDWETHPLERALRALEAIPVPTVAVLHGHAYGAGCELALTCDLRIASEQARLCLPPAKLGILYSATGLRRLQRLVGPSVAKELVFTAEVVGAERAERLGLLNRRVEAEALEATVATVVDGIVANDALSIRHHKTLFERFLAPAPLDAQTREAVAELREECFRSEGFERRAGSRRAR